MKLKALLQDVETGSFYTATQEITNITDDVNKVRHSGVFVCISGSKYDGHDFAQRAVEKGAVAVVCERKINCDNCIVVENSRKAYALMCANFYGNCHRKMKMIGITGTNGKTTTSYILKKMLEDGGYRVGVIGTVSVVIGNEKYPADLTTPNPADLHRYIMMMSIAGCDACIMEVSSQALSQQRVYGMDFDIGIFTNLSSEHLDYHKNMDEYANSKAILMQNSSVCVINEDDEYASFFKKKAKGNTVTYGIKKNSDFVAKNIRQSADGVAYSVKICENDYNVNFDGMGIFSVYNSLCALTVSRIIGIDTDRAVRSLARFDGICGRMEKVPNNLGINVIIDYAHTPFSLENVLQTLKTVYGGRIITVFGCGGDRDKSKRPIMGEIACKYSDTVFVTSDNPRTEKPNEIINDIVRDLKCGNFFKITDRTLAIKSALYSAKQGDTVLIAGKGHEKYQIIGTQKIYYNEKEIIARLLEDKARF